MPRTAFALLLFFFTATALFADAEPATHPSTTKPDEKIDAKITVTHHTLTVNGSALAYDASAGTITLKDDAGKPLADFFFIAYNKTPAGDPTTRPITFVFNGGPGAAAVWLHLGAVGPQRVKLGPDGVPGPPPHTLIPNDQTWLDTTDLVFIDPVGTGYSRAAEGQKASDFYGVKQDVDSIADFIRLYLTRYERWDSPKFLAGESYGTTRAAALSIKLAEDDGIDLNGIILISTVLDFATLDATPGNDLPFALYLPSYTAIAVYHHKIQTPDVQKLIDEVERYALHDYLDALAKGSALDPKARADVVDHLSRYTGLPADLIEKANLRIDPTMFRKQLLADQRLILGRFDARITGIDPSPADQDAEYDPSLSRYLPVYASAFNDYIRRELHYDSDLKYEVLSGRVGPWDFGRGGMGYLNVTDSLQRAMTGNPNLKILVCSGYEDLATPQLATQYTFNHLDLTGRLLSSVTQTHYHSGHMIYHNPEALKELKENVAKFITAAAGG